jgi:hypothetical protein
MEVSRWAVNFAKYLDAFGYENAGLGWGLSHISELNDEDHDAIIQLVTAEYD